MPFCSMLTYYSRIMLSAYLLIPHYAQCLLVPIILKIYYASIIQVRVSRVGRVGHGPPNSQARLLFFFVFFSRDIEHRGYIERSVDRHSYSYSWSGPSLIPRRLEWLHTSIFHIAVYYIMPMQFLIWNTQVLITSVPQIRVDIRLLL